MADTKQAFDWQSALAETYQEFTRQLIDHIPQLLGGLALLLFGWIAAWLLRLFARKLLRGFELLLLRAAQKRGSASSSPRSYARLGGDIVFWSV